MTVSKVFLMSYDYKSRLLSINTIKGIGEWGASRMNKYANRNFLLFQYSIFCGPFQNSKSNCPFYKGAFSPWDSKNCPS